MKFVIPRRNRYALGRMMANNPDVYIPFSQRTGIEPIPPQLKHGQVSDELRRLVDYYIGLEIDRVRRMGVDRYYFDGKWERVAKDFHVLFLKKDPDEFENSTSRFKETLKLWCGRAPIGRLFNLVEFFIRHQNCRPELKRDLSSAFVTARAAYRIFDDQYIVAIGTDEQASAVEHAIADAETKNAGAARKHLIAAGLALRNSDWASSVRESIHAVEAMALGLEPGTTTLGPALAALEKQGHLHGGLKAAFNVLYGYSSDEKGVRHALVFDDEAKVDEADALFMLGACASFVTYLLTRKS